MSPQVISLRIRGVIWITEMGGSWRNIAVSSNSRRKAVGSIPLRANRRFATLIRSTVNRVGHGRAVSTTRLEMSTDRIPWHFDLAAAACRAAVVAQILFLIGGGLAEGAELSFNRVLIPQGISGDAKMVGDLDGDGLPDIAIAGLGAPEPLVWFRYPD